MSHPTSTTARSRSGARLAWPPVTLLTTLLIIAVAAFATAGPARADGFAEQVERMRAGDLVLYFRHAATDHRQRDVDLSDMTRCPDQRNLSDAGRAQAQRIRQAFDAHDIPVGRVRRNTETATLAFGRHEIEDELFDIPGSHSRDHARLVGALRDMLATPATT